MRDSTLQETETSEAERLARPDRTSVPPERGDTLQAAVLGRCSEKLVVDERLALCRWEQRGQQSCVVFLLHT